MGAGEVRVEVLYRCEIRPRGGDEGTHLVDIVCKVTSRVGESLEESAGRVRSLSPRMTTWTPCHHQHTDKCIVVSPGEEEREGGLTGIAVAGSQDELVGACRTDPVDGSLIVGHDEGGGHAERQASASLHTCSHMRP